jgi:hypothetical protein
MRLVAIARRGVPVRGIETSPRPLLLLRLVFLLLRLVFLLRLVVMINNSWRIVDD